MQFISFITLAVAASFSLANVAAAVSRFRIRIVS